MALRLRRGTDAERLLITPEEGELIYVTDTKKLFVGDGATSGGVAVDTIGDPSFSLDDLTDVNTLTNPPNLNQALIWNGSQWVPGSISQDGSGVVDGSNYRINIISDDSTVMVDTETATFRGNFVGDGSQITNLTLSNASISDLGDVFFPDEFTPDAGDVLQYDGANFVSQKITTIEGDDSVIILDTSTNTFRGNFVGDGSQITNLTLSNASISDLGDVFFPDEFTPDAGDVLQYDGANFVSQKITTIEGDDNTIMLDTSTNTFRGNFVGDHFGDMYNGRLINFDSSIAYDGNRNFTGNLTGDLTGNVTGNLTGDVLGDVTGDLQGTVVGDVIGSVFGDDSTRLIDGTSGEFFVSEIISPTNTITIAPASGALRHELRLNALNNESAMKMLRSDSAVQPSNTRIASFKFDWEDDTNPNRTGALWGVNKDSMFYLINEAGTFTEESGFNYDIATGDGRFGINKFGPQATLHVNGDAIISGGLTADVTGSLFSDASTMLIDGTDGKLMAANVDVIGETGNTPVNDDPTTDAPTEWLELTVNGNTRYIPLYS